MSHKDTVFYCGNTAIGMDFSVDEIASDGAVLLLKKLSSHINATAKFLLAVITK